MDKIFWVTLLVGLGAGSTSAGTIQFQVTPLGGDLYQYNYVVSGITFQANEELDIRFDPSLYGTLSNGLAPSGFDLALLQPNNPPGVFGDYSALAEIANPSTAGPFSVEVVFFGPGQPGTQPFFVKQYDQNGFFVSTIGAGFATQMPDTSPMPEPSSLILVSTTLLLGGLWMVRRRLQVYGQQ